MLAVLVFRIKTMTTNRIPVTTPYLAVRVTEGQETICLPQAHPRQQGPLTLGRELRLCQLYLRRALPVQRLNRAIPAADQQDPQAHANTRGALSPQAPLRGEWAWPEPCLCLALEL